MMQRIRINQIYPRDNYDGLFEDDIQQSTDLEICFDEALGSDYEQDDEIAAKLQSKLSGKNKVIFLIGYRSSGKTTFLKKYFHIRYNTAVMQDDKLIVPVLGLGDVETKTPYQHAIGVIRSICDILEANEMMNQEGIEEFYSFILRTRADYLPALTFSQECSMPPKARKAARIDKMQKENELSYYLSRLKFFLSKDTGRCNKIEFILDNIQNIYPDAQMQREFVNYFLHIYECLNNYHCEIKNKKLQLYLIISVRPYNYRILKKDQHIVPYTASSIWKSNKFNNEKVLEKVLNECEEVFVGPEAVYSGPDGPYSLSQKLRQEYSEMIEKICFYDIVLIIDVYKRIILNKTWVKEGNFKYKPKNNVCLFDDITWIRALACGNSRVYQRIKHTDSTPRIDRLIPNLLYNEEDKDYGMLILYTMKYFLRQYDKDMECGNKYIQLEDYIGYFNKALDVPKEMLVDTIVYMCRTDILRRSIHDIEETDGESYSSEMKLGSKNKLYITVRGAKLWDMLKDNSVLLELCREDMYRETVDDEDSRKPSYDLMMMDGGQPKLFRELIKIIKELFEEEHQYYRKCCENGNKELYRRMFGKNPITRNTLLQGVIKSMRYSGCYYNLNEEVEKLEQDMTDKWAS